MEEATFHQEDNQLRYRYLTDEELTHFGEEFKQFLIVNGVHAEEWERLNKQTPEKAVQMVALFSDQVLQQVYEKIMYLEKQTEDRLFVFRYGEAEAQLILLQLAEERPADATFENTEAINHTLRTYPQHIKYYRTSKNYSLGREKEIHNMLSEGASPSDAVFWQALEKLTNDE